MRTWIPYMRFRSFRPVLRAEPLSLESIANVRERELESYIRMYSRSGL